MGVHRGLAISPGIVRGPAFVIQPGAEFVVSEQAVAPDQFESELDKFRSAVEQAEVQLMDLQKTVRERIGSKQADIFCAQILLLKDQSFFKQVEGLVRGKGINIEASLSQVVQEVSLSFQTIEDSYLRERASDIRDVGRRILSLLAGDGKGFAGFQFPEGTIVVAHELSPSFTAHLEAGKVGGFVTEKGGRASHAAILARSASIPAVSGVRDACLKIKNGDFLIIDAMSGAVHVNPTPAIIKEYDKVEADFKAHREALKEVLDLPSVTKDSVPIVIRANVGKLADAEAASLFKAEGVGLYRLEFAFAIQSAFPSEEDQFDLAKRVSEKFHPHPVVFRLLDIGADKPLSYFPLPESQNPSLALRGIRLLLANPEVLKSQLRALLRASAESPVKILLPMVGSLGEVLEFKKILGSVMEKLRADGLPFNPKTPLGAMIEVPSAALMVDRLADELDFFSIGTNDLVQYLLAADRDDSDMSYYYEPLHPMVLFLIRSIAETCRRRGKSLTLCGEMGGDPFYTELLVGLGIRDFSVAPGEILEVKKAVRSITVPEAEALAAKVLELGTVLDIEALLIKSNLALGGTTRKVKSWIEK